MWTTYINNKTNISRKNAIQEHRKMWNWIAEKSIEYKRKVTKEEYLSEFYAGISLYDNCFLCQYSLEKKLKQSINYLDIKYGIYHRDKCYFCPLQWGILSDYCCNNDLPFTKGLYFKWYKSKNYKKAARLAKKIDNVPEKKKESDKN